MKAYFKELRDTFAYLREHYGLSTALGACAADIASTALGWLSMQCGRLSGALADSFVAWEQAAYRRWWLLVIAYRDLRTRWESWRDDHPAVDFALWMALSLAVTALAFWIGVNLVALR